MDNLQSVIDQISTFGIEFAPKDLPLRVDGRRHTFGVRGKAYYRLFPWKTATGAELITGSFGSYKTGEWEKIRLNMPALTREQRIERKRQQAAMRTLAQIDRLRERERARITAMEAWQVACRSGSSAYLKRKGIEDPEAIRFAGDRILIPMLRYDEPRETALKGMQVIRPSGTKLFTKGMDKLGTACRLGAESDELILVAEGYATAMTVRMAIDRSFPVFVAFDAGNLLPVAQILRALYPSAALLVCADDDWRTIRPVANPGRTAARKLVRTLAGVHMTYPVFDPELRRDSDTDFNDLHVRQSIAAVSRQLRDPLKRLARSHGRA